MLDNYLALRSIVPKTPGLRMSYLAWEFAADRRLGIVPGRVERSLTIELA